MRRPPITVIMGSVDHGKTTLLDHIRETNVAAKEAGGITQSIGAYEIEHNGKKITFIDTPGHEAFTKMRARGANAADLAILVVAADDGVQPQTKESIKILKETETPFVVAINKIDRVPDTTKVKNELMREGVLLEGYGGNISNQAISAKTGQGVDDLLDLILLASEMEHLDYDPKHLGKGFVLESKLDSRRGVLVTVVINDGTVKVGDFVKSGQTFGKIKIMENFLGKPVKESGPSSPVRIFGFEELPKVGEEFLSGKNLERETSIEKKPTAKTIISKTAGTVRLVLRADVAGSLEALSQIIQYLPKKEHQTIEIIDENVGEITDGDIKLAVATEALVIGFKTKATKAAEALARAHGIKIVVSEIIYDLVRTVEETLATLEKKIVKGRLEILAVFGKKAGDQIIGGKVTEGIIHNNSIPEVERKEEVIGKGKILNLQKNKKDVKAVEAGNECGMLFQSEVEIRVGDILLEH
ncbi:MAG: translation initiation factor IF-2 [Candidatus Harrisonbacteria bacterium]|nr:translation initiation factor IF-2 [Candidatus Harrisonbacteria bacterium]